MVRDRGSDESDSICNAAGTFRKCERAFYRAVSRPSTGIICDTETALSTASTYNFNEMCIREFRIGCVDVRASFDIVKFWDSSCAYLRRYTRLWGDGINRTIVAVSYVVKTWDVKPWNGCERFKQFALRCTRFFPLVEMCHELMDNKFGFTDDKNINKVGDRFWVVGDINPTGNDERIPFCSRCFGGHAITIIVIACLRRKRWYVRQR